MEESGTSWNWMLIDQDKGLEQQPKETVLEVPWIISLWLLKYWKLMCTWLESLMKWLMCSTARKLFPNRSWNQFAIQYMSFGDNFLMKKIFHQVFTLYLPKEKIYWKNCIIGKAYFLKSDWSQTKKKKEKLDPGLLEWGQGKTIWEKL